MSRPVPDRRFPWVWVVAALLVGWIFVAAVVSIRIHGTGAVHRVGHIALAGTVTAALTAALLYPLVFFAGTIAEIRLATRERVDWRAYFFVIVTLLILGQVLTWKLVPTAAGLSTLALVNTALLVAVVIDRESMFATIGGAQIGRPVLGLRLGFLTLVLAGTFSAAVGSIEVDSPGRPNVELATGGLALGVSGVLAALAALTIGALIRTGAMDAEALAPRTDDEKETGG